MLLEISVVLWLLGGVLSSFIIRASCHSFVDSLEVSLWQLLCGSVVGAFWRFKTPRRGNDLGALQLVLLAVLNVIGLLTTNYGLAMGEVAFASVIKATEPCFLLVWLSIWRAGDTMSPDSKIFVAGAVLGAVMMSWDGSVSASALYSGIVANISYSLLNFTMKQSSSDIPRIFCLICMIPIPVALPLQLLGYIDIFNGGKVRLFILSGLVFALYRFASFWIVAKIHIMTHALFNLGKRIVVIVISVLWFHRPIALLGWIGASLTLASTACFGCRGEISFINSLSKRWTWTLCFLVLASVFCGIFLLRGPTASQDNPTKQLWMKHCHFAPDGVHFVQKVPHQSFHQCQLGNWSSLSRGALVGFHVSWNPYNNSGDELVANLWHLLFRDQVKKMHHQMRVKTSYLVDQVLVEKSQGCLALEGRSTHFFVWGGGSTLDWVSSGSWWSEFQDVARTSLLVYLNSPGSQVGDLYREKDFVDKVRSVLNNSAVVGGVRGHKTMDALRQYDLSTDEKLGFLRPICDVGILASTYYGTENSTALVERVLRVKTRNLVVVDFSSTHPAGKKVVAYFVKQLLKDFTVVLVSLSNFLDLPESRIREQYEFIQRRLNDTEAGNRFLFLSAYRTQDLPTLIAILRVAKWTLATKLHLGVLAVSAGCPFLYLQNPRRAQFKTTEDSGFWREPLFLTDREKFSDFLSMIPVPHWIPRFTVLGDALEKFRILELHREIVVEAYTQARSNCARLHEKEMHRFLQVLAVKYPAEFQSIFCSKSVMIEELMFSERSLIFIRKG